MRILVLGGTGAMGQPLIELLNKRGDEVYITSRRSHESKGRVCFIQGDAHDVSFLQKVLENKYDAIVDFMVYRTEIFKKRSKLFLEATDQYIFISSARVYDNSDTPITEDSPRLLDVFKDAGYLATDEYALAKARSEDVLFNSHKSNWTIIRPYITYNTKRLQLGGLELGSWVPRALRGGEIVLPGDVGVHETTMTYGNDVAEAISALIGNHKALGEAFHITGTDHMTWKEVGEIYCEVIEEGTGHRPELFMPDGSRELSSVLGNGYQIKYDRMYDRIFDNSKLLRVCEETLDFTSMKKGLRNCLSAYLNLPEHQKLKKHNVKFDAWADKSSGKGASVRNITGIEEKWKYLGYYYIPGIMDILKKNFKMREDTND